MVEVINYKHYMLIRKHKANKTCDNHESAHNDLKNKNKH